MTSVVPDACASVWGWAFRAPRPGSAARSTLCVTESHDGPKLGRYELTARRFVPLIPALLLGCGGNDGSHGSTIVRDSVGIEIVESEARSPDVWTVGAVPTLEIGLIDGDPSYQFHQVRSARQLSDGTVVVANGGTREVRFFDESGTFLGASGRRGAGPNEFENLAQLERTRGDSLVVYDSGLRRVTVLGPDGGFRRTIDLTRAMNAGPAPAMIAVALDGTLVGRTIHSADPASDGYTRDDIEIILLSAIGAEPVSIGLFAGGEVARRISSPSPGLVSVQERSLPFGRSTHVAAAFDRVFVGTSDRYEVREYGTDGILRRIVRRLDSAPEEIGTPALRRYAEAVLEELESMGNAPDRQSFEASILELPRAPSMPVFSDLLVDDLGMLWVQDYSAPWERDEPIAWTVFEEGGRLLGRVEIPSRIRVQQVGRDFVLGIATDDLGVESIVRLSLGRTN
jgi:hypothetical protein